MTSCDNLPPGKRQKIADNPIETHPNSNMNPLASKTPRVNNTTFFTLPRELRQQILLSSLSLESYLTYWREERIFIAYIHVNRDAISDWCEIMEKVSKDGAFIEDIAFCKVAFLKMIVEGQEEEDRSWCTKVLGVQYP